jgi:hypothetical protein
MISLTTALVCLSGLSAGIGGMWVLDRMGYYDGFYGGGQ